MAELPATEVTVRDRQVLVNGQPFLMRGVAYQPTPIGDDPSRSSPFGDYFTSNYRPLYERDLANLRAMGANTIRVYSWNFSAAHQDFLDRCYNGGTEPIYVLVNRWIDPNSNWSNAGVVTAIKNEYLAMVRNTGRHPAVLGYALGNELNLPNGNNAAFWLAMSNVAHAVKAAAPDRLVIMPMGEGLSQVARFGATMTSLDAWAFHIYRGATFGDLFSAYRTVSSKPMFVTEFGLDAFDHRAQRPLPNEAALVASTVASLWKELLANRAVASGGCVFAYSDEWWKSSGSARVQDVGGFPNASFHDGFMNEEWWGIFAVQDNGTGPDLLQPRALFTRLQELWAVPRISIEVSRSGPSVNFSFARRADRTDLTYSAESATDLTRWELIARSARSAAAQSENPSKYVVTEHGSGTERTVDIHLAAPANPAGEFFRVRVDRD